MDQVVEPLSHDDAQNLERARDWLKSHFTDHAEEKYATIEDKLRLLDTILDRKWVEPTETHKLQSLGVGLGDALAQKLCMEWVTADDEFGRSPALRFPETSVMAYPLTAISKRVEDGEVIDVFDLFAGFCERLSEMKSSGRYDLT